MIEVVPNPDELAISHEARRMAIVGCSSRHAHLKLLQQELVGTVPKVNDLPRLTLLALASGMQPQEYAQSHSMVAVRRVAARDGQRHEHGSPMAASFSRRLGMLPQRDGAVVCDACIDEMLAGPRRVSWYRRRHHLVGVDRCDLHGTLLHRVDEPNAFERLPHEWREAGKIKPFNPSLGDVPASGFLMRFVSIQEHLLTRTAPVASNALNRLIADRAKALGLRTSDKGRRPLLSDQLFKLADHRWLREHLPGVPDKRQGERFDRIDAIPAAYSLVASGDAYAMALAVVFDDVSEVIEALRIADSRDVKADHEVSQRPQKRTNQQFWYGDVWSYYIQCEGNVAKMAVALGMDRTYLGAKMAEIGLPSLHQAGGTRLWRAFLRLSEGSTLTAACAAEGVSIDDLGKLLSTCSARVARALEIVLDGHRAGKQTAHIISEQTETTVPTESDGEAMEDPAAEATENSSLSSVAG